MSSYKNEFDDLEEFVYGFDQSVDSSNEIGGWGRDEMSFFHDFVQEENGRHFQGSQERVPENQGGFSGSLGALEDNQFAGGYSSHPFNMGSNILRPSADEYPYQTGSQDMNSWTLSTTNPYRTGYQFARPLADPIFGSTGVQGSSVRPPSVQNPYQGNQASTQDSRRVTAATIAVSPESYNIHNAQALGDPPSVYTDNSLPKREVSATISRRLSEITAEHDETFGAFARKRKRSSEDEKTEPEEVNRPKYVRKVVNANARYRNALRNSRPEPSRPKSVKHLFRHLKSKIVPKKAYYRKKGSNATASHPPIPPQASTALSGTGGATSSPSNKTTRPANSRQHIPVETVRDACPEGWDPYNNEYYSGDDNVSDGGIEEGGKATDYKPPRMACRRCNKLKQPCDHAYPACSLCAKHGERCRYRDDLTGRQIRPGQLEEVEVALQDAQKEIKSLKKKLERLEEGQNPRDDPQE